MGVARKRTKKEQYDMKVIHRSFTNNLEGLRIFVDNVAPVARKLDETTVGKIEKSVKKMLKILGISEVELEDEKKIIAEVKWTREQIERIIPTLIPALQDLRRLTPPQIELLYRSSFVMLACYFDFLLSDLIHCFYQTFPPESLSGKDRSITLNELLLCSDLSEAIGHIVKKEIDGILYDTLENQKRYFEKHLNIEPKEHIVEWSRINEAIERRNIVVHNNSKINRRYLKNVDLSVAPEKKKDLKEGRGIVIGPDYFATAFDEILIAGVVLIQGSWRKWKKDNLDDADSALIEDIYDALLKEKWTVAERLGLFAKECKPCNERNRLYLHVNYLQSLKWQNKKDELEKELKEFDVSGLSPRYQLAVSALKSDKDGFHKNLEAAIRVDKMEKKDFIEWPLFRELREDPAYEETIEKAFASISQEKQE